MPRDKEKQKEYFRQYHENNKEKRREQMKQYRENNKEKMKEYFRQRYQDNKEKIMEYREINKEKIAEQRRQHNQTPKRIKNNRILNWKKSGVKLPDDYPDWDIFYEEEYMKTTPCEECGVGLTEDKRTTPTTKCLDHCHITGEFRNILCHICNVKRK